MGLRISSRSENVEFFPKTKTGLSGREGGNSKNSVLQASCSPDMAPRDVLLFRPLKCALCGHRFQSIDSIKENLLRVFTKTTSN